MRIIYEDGEYRDNIEEVSLSQKADSFVDVSSLSEEQQRIIEEENREGKPYRPAATLRPAPEKAEPVSETAPQPVPYPQGYPVQYIPVQYPQGYPYPQYPQAYPYGQYPQGYPVQYPQGYPVQYSPVMPQTAQAPADPNKPDAGTRVLYQSPDFDKKETPSQSAMPKTVPSRPVYTMGSGITQSDIDPYSKGTASRKSSSFEVDDMEMSVFELDSMAHKYHTSAKQVAKPVASGSSLRVEEFEESFDSDEEELWEIKEDTSRKAEDDFNTADADYDLGHFPEDDEEEPPKKKSGSKTASGKKSSKKKKKSDLPRKIVLAISLIAIIVSVAVLINEARLSKENQNVEQEVSDLIIDVPEIDDSSEDEGDGGEDKDENKDKDEDKGTEEEKEPEVQLTPEQQWEKVKSEYPNVVFPSDIQLKYAKLYATNREFIGYLSAPGVKLNLPVVQTDNDETYLNKNFYGKNTKYGCPFVTHLNNIGSDPSDLDTNTVIFGHYMKDGSVFGNLFKYKTIDGFKAAPVIEFNTLYNDYKWKVIAAFITNADEKDDNGYVFKYYFTNLTTRDRYSAFLSELSQRSIYDTGVDVLPDDKILTLSTCSYEFENARFVVVARLVRFGESAEVDVSKATDNPNPRYPQAYYDKKKKDNPYKDAYRWEVG